ASEGRQHRDGIESRSVMMQLTLARTSGCRAVENIPETSGAGVVSPVRYRWHVTQDGVERDLRFRIIAEILRDSVDLFLTSGIPSHFASIRQCATVPVIGACLHLTFKRRGLSLPAFSFEVIEQKQKD